MSKQKILTVLYFCVLLCVVVRIFWFSIQYFSQLTPIVIDKDYRYVHAPLYTFYVVGYSKDGQYSLLSLYDYSSNRLKELHEENLSVNKDSRKQKSNDAYILWDSKVLWDSKDILKYSYYLSKRDLDQIVQKLHGTFSDELHEIRIEILADENAAKKQIILLEYARGDSIYYCEYQVSGNVILPLRYGDLTKKDGFLSIVISSLFFLAGIVVWFIAFILLLIKKKGFK